MSDAISAELLKLLRLRATWLLAWIYPIMLALLTLGILIYGLASDSPPLQAPSAMKWSLDSANFWLFPQSTFSRYLVASFAVFCTASEYGWNTWKLIVPARARWQLLSAKLVATILLPLAAVFAYGYAPALTHLLAEALPFYHLANIKSWFQEGTALLLPLGASAKLSGGLALSLLITGIWTILFAGGAILQFKRQDLD